ncbi:unnamed protein product [Soboliphyme baturini]|uniref:LITAF domain-containing protein n=1 Tax=Soboliphyme baturini TaxID=241478 RepID=A0A183J4I7_9BILA|nr:unnamed protein product [Soboliphyme baturini]
MQPVPPAFGETGQKFSGPPPPYGLNTDETPPPPGPQTAYAAPPPATAIIITETQPTLGPHPQDIQCPSCHNFVRTLCTPVAGLLTWLLCLLDKHGACLSMGGHPSHCRIIPSVTGDERDNVKPALGFIAYVNNSYDSVMS